MKKTITLMFIFIIVYLVAMFFVEKNFNYDWTPATPRPLPSNNIKDFLAKEGLPASFKDSAIQDSVIEEGILPSENKNYLDLNFENTIQDKEDSTQNKENIANALEDQNLTESEETPPDTIKPLQEEPLQEEPLQIAPLSEKIKITEKPLTLKEQLETKNLVDIETLPVKIFLDLRYATENNFTGRKLYKQAKCYLKKPAAAALERAAKAALQAEEHFYFCIYDCYRPSSAQKILLANVEEEGFVSKVSNHSRGMAVDLGPCDENGEPLLTPTDFDTFSELSGAYYYGDEIPQLAIKNRTALQNVMKEAGFSTISKEWWHFDYKNAKNEELLDIKF